MDDNELHNQLNRPPIPDDLEAKLRSNWHEQMNNRRNNVKPAMMALIAASFFGIVIGTALINNGIAQKDLIKVAMNDIVNDKKQNAGIILPINSVIEQTNIHSPPKPMTVKMSKVCNLNGNKAFHLTVAGAKQGEVDLFIKKGNFDLTPSSQNKDMPWKLIKPRDNISVLILYTKDMNPANVERLIQTMFYT